jgi:hypothetical protein
MLNRYWQQFRGFSVELRVDITLALYISMNTNFGLFEAETTKNV